MNQFLLRELKIDDEVLELVYYICLPISTILVILLICYTIKKIKGIRNKESYSATSVWINYMSIVNLSIQLCFNIWMLAQLFNTDYQRSKVNEAIF